MARNKVAASPNAVLRQVRLARGWSQEHIADLLGTSAVMIYRWEQGRVRPSPYYRQKLMALFGQSAEALGLLPPLVPVPVKQKTFCDVWPPLAPLGDGFIGRDALLADLRLRLMSGVGGVVLGLYGLPGVGKTALATELAHDAFLRAHFVDGVLWVGLGPTPTAFAELRYWGAAVGLANDYIAHIPTPQDLARAIQRTIGSRQVLLILDDAWPGEEAFWWHLGGPRCATLVTTRFPQVAAQFAHANVLRVPELTDAEGMTLVSMLAPTIVEQHAAALHPIVQASAGLPLALTLIGHYLHAQSLGGQERRLHLALQRLQSADTRLHLRDRLVPAAALPGDTHISLYGAIALSMAALSPAAQTFFPSLALFPPKPNTFTEDAAAALFTALEPETWMLALDELVDAGLVESSLTGRYMVHQSIAEYLRQTLPALPTQQRFVTYYGRYAAEHEHAREQLGQEQANLQAAFTLADAQTVTVPTLHGMLAFARFLLAHGLYPQTTVLLQQVIAGAHAQGALREEAWAWYTMGQVHLAEDRYDHGITAAEQSLVLAQQCADPVLSIQLAHLQGNLAMRLGNYDQAEQEYRAGIALSQAHGLHMHHVHLRALGLVFIKRGELAQAERCYTEGYALARSEGDAHSSQRFLQALGVIAAQRGELARARHYFEEALLLARHMELPQDICILLANLAVAHEMGDSAQALIYLTEGIQLARHYGFRERLCGLLAAAGEVAQSLEQTEQAHAYLQEGLVVARAINSPDKIGLMLLNLGQQALQNGDLAQAAAYLQEGRDLAHRHQHKLLGRFIQEWGNLAYQEGQFAAAHDAYQEALTLAQTAGYSEAQAGALFGLAQVAEAQHEGARAQDYAHHSLALYESMGHRQAAVVREWQAHLVVTWGESAE